MGIYSTLSASENLSLGGPTTLIQLAIAGLTFCSRAVDLYLALSAPSQSSIRATTDHISTAKLIARRVVDATAKHGLRIVTAKNLPTIQAARTIPIQLSTSTSVLPNPSHLGFVISFLAICALLSTLAGVAVLHSTGSPVAPRHTDANCPGPNTNQASTPSGDAPASHTPSPRLGRRSGGSGGGNEPSTSNDEFDITVKIKAEDGIHFFTLERGDPPPPDGPPPPSPATDDPEDDGNDTDADFWAMIFINFLCGAVVGQILVRIIRAFNRYRYFAALRRAGKPKREPVVAMPGMSLGTAAASSNGTSVSLYGKSSVHASLSEGISLRQAIIANAALLSLDSVVPKSSSVSVAVVKSPVPSCVPWLVSQHPCFSRSKGTSRPTGGALLAVNSEPLPAHQRRPAAHKPFLLETVQPDGTSVDSRIVICIFYVTFLALFILWCFFTGDLESSLPKHQFNKEPLATLGDEERNNVPPQIIPPARRTYEGPKDAMSKEELEQSKIETMQICDSLDKFLSGRLTTIVTGSAHNVLAPPPIHPESQTIEHFPLPLGLSEPSLSENGVQEPETDATERPGSGDDLTSTIDPHATSAPMFTGSPETAVDGERSHEPHMNDSEEKLKSADLQTADPSGTLISAPQPQDYCSHELSLSGAEATPVFETVVLVDSEEAVDVRKEFDCQQLDDGPLSIPDLETATDLGTSVPGISASDAPVDAKPVDSTPINDITAHGVTVNDPPLEDTLLLPLPSTILQVAGPVIPVPSASDPIPSTVPALPEHLAPPQSPQSGPSTKAGPSSTVSQLLGTPGHVGDLDSSGGPTVKLTNNGHELVGLDDTPLGRGPRKSRRGKRGIKKSPSARAKLSETTQDLHSESWQAEFEGDDLEVDAPVPASKPEGTLDNSQGKKDSAEYPTSARLTAGASSSQFLASATLSELPPQIQDLHDSDDFCAHLAESSIAPLYDQQDLVFEDEPTPVERVENGEERENRSEAPSTTSEPLTTESSHKTAETSKEGAQVDSVESQNPVDPNATSTAGSRKEKEKDPPQYPVAGPSTFLAMQPREHEQSGSAALPCNDAHSTGLEPVTNAHFFLPLNPTGQHPSDNQHLDNNRPPAPSRRTGNHRRKDKKQQTTEPSEAGPSTSEGLPRHGKRRRLGKSAAENEDSTQPLVENRGSSLLDSIHAPRPALPLNRPDPNPTLHPELAAAVPNASPSGILISQLGESRVVQVDPPVRTSPNQQPPAVQPNTPAVTPPHTLTTLEQPSSPFSPRLPARTKDLDYHVALRAQTVQSRSRTQSPHRRDPEAESLSSSSDGSVRRRSSFSDNFRFARQVTVPWEEELEADRDDAPPEQESPPPQPVEPRPRGTSTADSIWATHE